MKKAVVFLFVGLICVPGCNKVSFSGKGFEDGTAAPIACIDTIDFKSGSLKIAGWAADENDGTPSSIEVFIDNKLVGTTVSKISRPDVARFFSNEKYTNAGWTIGGNIDIPFGNHTVSVIVRDKQNNARYVEKKFTVK